MKTRYVITAAFCLSAATAGFGMDTEHPAVGIFEKLGQQIPGDIGLYDEAGNLKTLDQLVNKPTVIALVYYECPGICTPLLNEVAVLVDKIDLTIGKEYQILTISFDYTESCEIAAGKKDNYVNELRKKIDPAGWQFLTGDSMNIARLTDALGFYFKRNGKDWIHPTGLIMISPDRKIIRYLYGINQLPLDVKLAVIEAQEGHPGPTVAKILNICYSYDPESKHYIFNFVQIGGMATLVIVAAFFIVFIARKGKKGRPKKKRGRK